MSTFQNHLSMEDSLTSFSASSLSFFLSDALLAISIKRSQMGLHSLKRDCSDDRSIGDSSKRDGLRRNVWTRSAPTAII